MLWSRSIKHRQICKHLGFVTEQAGLMLFETFFEHVWRLRTCFFAVCSSLLPRFDSRSQFHVRDASSCEVRVRAAEIRAAISHIVQSEYHKRSVIPSDDGTCHWHHLDAAARSPPSPPSLPVSAARTSTSCKLLRFFDKSFIIRVKQVMHHSPLWWWRRCVFRLQNIQPVCADWLRMEQIWSCCSVYICK